MKLYQCKGKEKNIVCDIKGKKYFNECRMKIRTCITGKIITKAEECPKSKPIKISLLFSFVL